MKTPNLYLLVAALVLASCTTQVTTPPIDTTELEARAAGEVAAGNLAGAIQVYRQLAAAVTGSRRSGFLIEVARLEIDLGDRAAALLALEMSTPNADPVQAQMIATLLARMDLEEGRPEEALARLSAVQSPLTTDVLIASSQIRGLALFAVGRVVDAIRVLSERELWLDDAALILANQRAIWEGLQASTVRLGDFYASGDAVIDGWLALAPIAESRPNDDELRRALLRWRVDHATHPAATMLLSDLLSLERGTRDFPVHIALLLPLSSPAREAALAIQDGFMAAHFSAPDNHATTIRVYDTGTQGGGEAYFQAQLNGADFIVGPLLREEVDDIVVQTGFVPTLALNWAQTATTAADSFFQFALSPEDEASAIARRAIASGAQRAVAMMQSNADGNRIFNSFREEFEALGGQVLAAMPYEAALQDFSTRINSLMNIDKSYQRHRRLEANLGVDVSFEPRRRQDIDIIFLSAQSDVGRLLAPQLQYNYAGNIPSYATSDIYDPALESRDNDLNGIIFPDVPWLVAPDQFSLQVQDEIRQYWPQRSANMPRFYGMGVDAYRFVPAIYRGDTLLSMHGASGALSTDADRRIHRQLPFAQFQNGRPQALPPLPELTRQPDEPAPL